MAVEPGDWRKIHLITRAATPDLTEEAVICGNCNTVLLASPDDDIDPIANGQDYDKACYHTFAKPVGFQWPSLPETTDQTPEVGHWVVVVEHNEGTRDLYGSEGYLTEIKDQVATVRLSGFMRMDQTVEVPIGSVRPVKFERFIKYTKVKIKKGTHSGEVGIVAEVLPAGRLRVTDPSLQMEIGIFTSSDLSVQ